jgi:serine/threonine-protein kinase
VEDWIDAEPLESLGPPPLPVEKAVELTVLLLRILGALHLRRPPVVVREIRPGNLLVSGEKLWLVDLSSARRLDGSLDTVAPGPPGFAAPEHYQGRSQRRSDIFSAGALLHYLLTGQVADLSHLPCSPRTLRPEVPLELDRVVRRATQMDPLNRYDSASEMARDLRLVLNPPAPARQAPDRPALADVKAPRWAVILGLAAGVAVLSAPFLPGPGLDPVWMALRWSVPALAGVFCLLGLMLLWHGLRPG